MLLGVARGCKITGGPQLKEDTIEGHFERGQLYLMAGEKGLVAAYPLAAEDFSWILKKDPKHVGALGNRGMAYVRSGQIDEALADFKMVTEVKPDDSYGYTVYAQVLPRPETTSRQWRCTAKPSS